MLHKNFMNDAKLQLLSILHAVALNNFLFVAAECSGPVLKVPLEQVCYNLLEIIYGSCGFLLYVHVHVYACMYTCGFCVCIQCAGYNIYFPSHVGNSFTPVI